MKKTILTLLVMLLTAVCVYSQSGVIRELSGEVELKLPGAAAFKTAKAGDEISRDTIVSTGFKSAAVIVVGSTVLTVRPLTRLSLADIQSSAGVENLNVNLQTGRVKVDVKPPAGSKANTTVQGPSATASVRGTSFEMDTVNLNVSEGTVAFKGKNGAVVMVNAGGSSYVGGNGKAVDPVIIGTSNLMPSVPGGKVNNNMPSTPINTYPSIPGNPPVNNGIIGIEVQW